MRKKFQLNFKASQQNLKICRCLYVTLKKKNKTNTQTNGLVILSMSYLFFLHLFICQSPWGLGQIAFYLLTLVICNHCKELFQDI